jgi:purine-binding chemotaxis protein CheW
MSENGTETHNLVAFRLNEQLYALPIEPIVQIVEMVTITPLPQVNHAMRGIINVHGTAVPVLDLRQHLGLADAGLRLHTPIILVKAKERQVGLIVDQVTSVMNVPVDRIAHPADVLPPELGQAPLLRGLAHTEAGMVLLLDLEHLFEINSNSLAAVQSLARSMELAE